jgi:hypothetical protein
MSDKETETQEGTELAPGDVTDFMVVFMQLAKGRTQADATKALHECVAAALATGKKNGSLTIKVKVEPLESGAVTLIPDVTSSPAKDPAGTIFFADGEGNLSRDNAGLFYGTK